MLHHWKIVIAFLAGSAFLTMFATATADDYWYGFGTDKAVGLDAEVFRGDKCFVRVRGPRGGSRVKGTYDNPDGLLMISADYSYVEIHGRARKVIVKYVDPSAGVNLTNLKIGDGGIIIKSVDNASVMQIGSCDGPVEIRSVENASIVEVPRGTRVKGIEAGLRIVTAHFQMVVSVLALFCGDCFSEVQPEANKMDSLKAYNKGVSLLADNPFIQIEAPHLCVVEGESDELCNDGIYGKALCEYLQSRLAAIGYDVPWIVCEDWGWYVPLRLMGSGSVSAFTDSLRRMNS